MSWTYPSGFSAATALIYANFVQQAYFQYYIDAKAQTEFGFPPYSQVISIPPSGYTLLYDIQYNEGFIETDWTYFGYVAQLANNPDSLVFAIRGTEDMIEWTDVLLSSNTGASGINNVQGNIHQGFAAIYKGLTYFKTGTTTQVPLSTILENVSSIVVTGHSLGAALAILLTTDIALNHASTSLTPSLTCYSFAAPNVGDPTFANFFNNLLGSSSYPTISAHYRVANGWDPVPNLPPNVFYDPFDAGKESDYMQVNSYCPVDSGMLGFLSDPHSMSSYAQGLNYVVTPPTPEEMEEARKRSHSGIGTSGSAKTMRRVRAATTSLRG